MSTKLLTKYVNKTKINQLKNIRASQYLLFKYWKGNKSIRICEIFIEPSLRLLLSDIWQVKTKKIYYC